MWVVLMLVAAMVLLLLQPVTTIILNPGKTCVQNPPLPGFLIAGPRNPLLFPFPPYVGGSKYDYSDIQPIGIVELRFFLASRMRGVVASNS